MKPTNPLYPITRPAPLLFIIVLIIFTILATGCSTQKYYAEIYKEDLLYLPTKKDRLIIDIKPGVVLKKRTYYKVIDKDAKPVQRVYVSKGDSVGNVGGILICKFNLHH